MQVATIYDIHSNLHALEAVLQDLERLGVDQVLVGGDVVPGPQPLETFERLLDPQFPAHFIRGNGDREVLARMAGKETDWYRSAAEAARLPVRWTARQLTPSHRKEMQSWPATCRIEIAGLGSVLFCHATPRNDTDCFTRSTPEEALRPIFQDCDSTLVICGHTHMQFDRQIAGVRVVNAGSVGMPFGSPGAYWLLLGPGVELRRTDYDLKKAAEDIRRSDYPQAEQFAVRSLLRPPSEDEMIRVFSRLG